MKENVIYIVDDQGKEVEMNILLTFEANDKNYVVVYETDKEDDIYAFIYDDDGNLFEVETQEELDMVQEVVSAYEQEEN
ncbi:MAG: DUF1292 domain-containing protein [Firmicutes bacterium]|nr:DUF1292 domain-containing protein [Candidatus Colivicinus equi]